MKVELTEEQQLLAKTADQLARTHSTATPADLEAPPDDIRAWTAVADAGWPALHIGLDDGGAGASGVEVAIVAQPLARWLCRIPFAGAALGVELLAAARAPAALLAEVAAGTRRFVPVLDASLSRLAAVGEPGYAWDAQGAEAGLRLDTSGSDARVVATDLATDSVAAIDPTRRVVTVAADAAVVDVGGVDVSAEALDRWTALALATICADLVGVMEGALAMAVAHAADRVQFDRPIGSFQAVQHICADQHVTLEAARSCTWHAAWAVDELAPAEALLAARTAKAFCAEGARAVTEAGIQVHGGIGMTWESLAHVYLRRALLDRQTLGDEHHQLAAIADVRLEEAR